MGLYRSWALSHEISKISLSQYTWQVEVLEQPFYFNNCANHEWLLKSKSWTTVTLRIHTNRDLTWRHRIRVHLATISNTIIAAILPRATTNRSTSPRQKATNFTRRYRGLIDSQVWSPACQSPSCRDEEVRKNKTLAWFFFTISESA